MSELKYQLMLNKDMSWVPCYLKSETDKVIADLEESHKKEVEQLLMEIVELKAKADKLHSCLKCLVMRDLIKDCPEKKSAIEIVKEAK